MKPWVTKVFGLLGGEGGGFLGKTLDKVLRDKMPEADRRTLEAELQKEMWATLQAGEDSFRSFVLEYEGKAADQHPFIQVYRGIVRPTITFVAFACFMWGAYEYLQLTDIDKATQFLTVLKWIFSINVICLVFWFGDRAVQKSGLLDIWRSKKP